METTTLKQGMGTSTTGKVNVPMLPSQFIDVQAQTLAAANGGWGLTKKDFEVQAIKIFLDQYFQSNQPSK